MLSSDGTVAEQGTYKELSSNPGGAFSKLMEWQMSGGDTESGGGPSTAIASEPRGPPTESEEIQLEHAKGEGEGEEDVEEEGVKVRKGEETASEAVLEKAGKQAG